MHNLNVRILGPSSFISTLNELKMFLKFNCLSGDLNNNSNVILFHVDALLDKKLKEYLQKADLLKFVLEREKILPVTVMQTWNCQLL